MQKKTSGSREFAVTRRGTGDAQIAARERYRKKSKETSIAFDLDIYEWLTETAALSRVAPDPAPSVNACVNALLRPLMKNPKAAIATIRAVEIAKRGEK